MLVLSRKLEEEIYIVNEETGDVITLKYLDGRGKKISLGLDGPQKYKFIRSELYERVRDRVNSSPPETLPVEIDRSIHFSGSIADESN